MVKRRRLGHERQTRHEYQEQPVITIEEEREKNLPHKSDIVPVIYSSIESTH
jgi:hypothetical protein